MQALPVIVGYGGYNAAGRSSDDQAYRRIVLENLDSENRQKTIVGLACLMNLVKWTDAGYLDSQNHVLSAQEVANQYEQAVCDGTLIRRIAPEFFDCDATPWNQKMELESGGAVPLTFQTRKRSLPPALPENWQVEELDGGKVQVTVEGSLASLVPSSFDFPVKAAGQLPSGFDPAETYNARFQPRGLQMAVLGASDAVHSLGIDWQTICDAVEPDEIGVYASSVMSQCAQEGLGGVLSSRLNGSRPTAKMIPMSLNSMPADFVNAYVLGSVGHSEAITGACASFLYCLHAAVRDITNGVRRVAVVGCSEAPVLSTVMEGYANMGALCSDDALKKLDGADSTDPRRYSRPFGANAGFTVGESSQYTILMDDALAIELGADIHGAVPGVFIDADGVKKSISSPGPGNYVTMAKAVSLAASILGDEAVQKRSMVQAHGSSTPANRVTESLIFHQVAEAFGIENWPVSATKAYVGHSMGPASGDQMNLTLGMFHHGIIPGIKTIDAVADDVYDEHLTISVKDMNVGVGALDVAFLNSKGFGGNNATATVFSPQVTEKMLAQRYGEAFDNYRERRETTRAAAQAYAERADRAQLDVIYRFGEGMIDEEGLSISREQVVVPGFKKPIPLNFENPYGDMTGV
jgi:acetoacetyl-[acyl-carrier protein] synthase